MHSLSGKYRGREALQRGLKRYEYLFAVMSAFEQWRAVKRCCVVEVKVQFLVLRQSAEAPVIYKLVS